MKSLSLLVFFLATLLLPATDIVIARGQERKSSPSQNEMDRQANAVIRHYSQAGIDFAAIKDTELTSATLKGVRLVVFPYNAPLPANAFTALSKAVKNGCKVLAFYLQDPNIAALLGLNPPKYVPSSQFGYPTRIAFNTARLQGLPTLLPHTASVGCNLAAQRNSTALPFGEFQTSQNTPTGYHAAMMHANGIAFAHVFPTADRALATQLLLALTATAIPDIWNTPVQTLLTSIGTIGDCKDIPSLRKFVQSKLPGPAAIPLSDAEQLLHQAQASLTAGRHADAYIQGMAARDAFRKAYLLSCGTLHHELRGVWLHSAYGIRDWGWDKTIQVLKDNGFNAIFVNMLWGYVADYPSTVLPNHPDVAKKGDQIQLCLDACRKYGVQLHVWKVCWNMGHRTAPKLKEQLRRAGRTQVLFDGTVTDFLAPHLEVNQDLETAAFLEIVRKYPVDGIHLDYIRYTDEDSDYSPSARQSFETFLKAKVPSWPADCTIGGALRKRFNTWRQNNISRLVERVSREAHALRPDIKVSAAVYGGWDNCPHSVAQSPELWLENGWLDFACPMNYTPDTQYFRDLTARQAESIRGRRPFYVGIGSYMLADAPAIAEQIELARAMGTDGFVCFSHNLNFAHNMLPLLGKTVTAGQATPPFAHSSPAAETALAPGKTPLLTDAFALSETVSASMTFPVGWQPPVGTSVRLLRNGHAMTRQPPLRLAMDINIVSCTFTPDQPGIYRIEVTDDKTFVTRSRVIPVLTKEEVLQKQLEEKMPQFAHNGKPRIGIWQHRSYGEQDIFKSLAQTGKYDVGRLYNLKPSSLDACTCVIIPQPRIHPALFTSQETIDELRAYVSDGGALLVTHALVGIRNFPILFPEIVASAKEPTLKASSWKRTAAKHPILKNLTLSSGKSSFPDMVAMLPGPNGTAFLADSDSSAPVAIAGAFGKGRVVALGLGIGIGYQDKDCELSNDDRQLLLAIAKWLTLK